MSTAERRLVILAEGNFGFHHGKTAMGVIRYGRDRVMAVVDSTQAGRNVREWLGDSGRYDIPIVASLSDALGLLPRADTLLVGIAPTGGQLPDEWRSVILSAIRSGLDVHAGLHTFLSDDPEFVSAAQSAGVRLVDYRRTPETLGTAVGRRHLPGRRVILTVGSDCAVGKMSVAVELARAAAAAGASAVFVPTGQTGIMIEGWGLAVDRVISDFLQGSVEQLVADGEERGDWLIVEGQGSLDHPAYSSVTLGLIHGATPHAMVLVHQPGLEEHDFEHVPEARFPIADLRTLVAAHEMAAALIAPSKVVAIALNTSLILDPDDARRVIADTETETGLPTDDPVRFGATALWDRVAAAVEELPWVEATSAEPGAEPVPES
jgi:uncharacterized NAD-dependent epimerase/dehydratase family protein